MRTYLDHENFDVCQLELRFVAWVAMLLKKIKRLASECNEDGEDENDPLGSGKTGVTP